MRKLAWLIGLSWLCASGVNAWAATSCSSTIGTQGCPGQPVGAVCVQVSFAASTQPPTVVSYNLYRGTTSGTEGTTPYVTGLISSGGTVAFQDNNIPAGATALYYQAAAVGSGGLKSTLSAEGCAQIPAPPQTPGPVTAVPNVN
jgi:hypothetical protein